MCENADPCGRRFRVRSPEPGQASGVWRIAAPERCFPRRSGGRLGTFGMASLHEAASVHMGRPWHRSRVRCVRAGMADRMALPSPLRSVRQLARPRLATRRPKPWSSRRRPLRSAIGRRADPCFDGRPAHDAAAADKPFGDGIFVMCVTFILCRHSVYPDYTASKPPWLKRSKPVPHGGW